ncbi:MAG: hypothetical protein S0880_18015 [Actinomycetota bacterium]|nr:hypothetical protein [Actinomycetota bacterium]
MDEDDRGTTAWEDAQPRSYPEPADRPREQPQGSGGGSVPARREPAPRRRRRRRSPEEETTGRAGLDTILMAVVVLILTVAVTYLLLVPQNFAERVVAVIIGIAIFGIGAWITSSVIRSPRRSGRR